MAYNAAVSVTILQNDLIIEVQDKTLEFQINMVELIIHDVENLSLEALQRLPAQPEPDSLFSQINHTIGEELALASVAAEMRYRVPTKATFPLLMSLVQTRIDSARDLVWELREDPGYYQDAVKAWGTICTNHGQRIATKRNSAIFGLSEVRRTPSIR